MSYLISNIPYFKVWVRKEFTAGHQNYHGEGALWGQLGCIGGMNIGGIRNNWSVLNEGWNERWWSFRGGLNQ